MATKTPKAPPPAIVITKADEIKANKARNRALVEKYLGSEAAKELTTDEVLQARRLKDLNAFNSSKAKHRQHLEHVAHVKYVAAKDAKEKKEKNRVIVAKYLGSAAAVELSTEKVNQAKTIRDSVKARKERNKAKLQALTDLFPGQDLGGSAAGLFGRQTTGETVTETAGNTTSIFLIGGALLAVIFLLKKRK